MNSSKFMVTKTLCEFAEKINYSSIPTATVEQTKKFIADYYAASIAGFWINSRFNCSILSMIREMGGKEQARVLFQDEKYPVTYAAYMNAIYAHGADMDDGNRKAAGHIGASVMSAVFAMADSLLCKWEDVIVAINVGYEFFNRVVGAGQPGVYNKGFHSTGVGGALASAAACAKLMGLDSNRIYDAVSLAAVQSGGLIIIDESGQCCKPINPANAARIGVESALLASKGIESPRNPLESQKGWYNAFSSLVDTTLLMKDLGVKFTICESYLKRYPSCRHTHSSIDAVLEIRDKITGRTISATDCRFLNGENVSRIEVYIYPSAIKSAGNITHPMNCNEAKFSIKYAVAVAYITGSFTLNDLNTAGKNPNVDSLIERINIISCTKMENKLKGIRGSKVVVHYKDGRVIESYVPLPKGEGDYPLDWNDLAHKMVSCSNWLFDDETAEKVIMLCKTINTQESYHSIAERITELAPSLMVAQLNRNNYSSEIFGGGGITAVE